MVQNGPKFSKWFKMLRYVQKWSKTVLISPKYAIWSKIVQHFKNGQKRFKMVQIDPTYSKWSSMIRYCPKRFKMVLKRLERSNMVKKIQNGPIRSKFIHLTFIMSQNDRSWYVSCWGNSSYKYS